MFDQTAVWTIFFFFFGSLWGSFANVAIYRLPENLSVVRPRSHCKSCKVPVRWYDNIPILSWFILKGKCRACGCAFSFRYPFVEILTGVLFAMAFYFIGWKFYLAEVFVFLLGLVIISFIDIDHFIIPDKISLPGIGLGLVGAALNPERPLLDAALGVLLGGGFLWMVAYLYYVLRKQEGMGGGDIKLLAWMGSICGWKSVPFIILCASILGTFTGLLKMKTAKNTFQTVIPFGPYLAVAAVIYLFAGQSIALWYIRSFFPWLE